MTPAAAAQSHVTDPTFGPLPPAPRRRVSEESR
jgi:hypothetical protein